jgi:hypothetical protein
LLQNPSAPEALYSEPDITSWVNQARLQVAAESAALRVLGTIDTVVAQRPYDFEDIDIGTPADTGIEGVLNIRTIMFGVGDGQLPIHPKSWEWFQYYKMGLVVPNTGRPSVWAQYRPGSTGNFYVDPIPDEVLTMTCDCVGYPIDLEDDDSVDAIPKLWDVAVPYFAAYLALLSAQTGAREDSADRMANRYKVFVDRARQFSNPEVNTYLYPQSMDQTLANKLSARGGIPGA